MNIKIIDFITIYPVWKHKMWPNRVSPIETHSAMMLDRSCSMENFNLPVCFYAIYENNQIIGVNSCHMCSDNTARSRGLWVDPAYRGNGFGQNLLKYAIETAKQYKADRLWSYPNKNAWETYKSVGFSLLSPWETSETGINAFASIDI
jgi:N-acetylglutamate synthase-like GNAT family acetyltransferase